LLWRYSHISLNLFDIHSVVFQKKFEDRNTMLKNFVEIEKEKTLVFQVLLLDNNGSQVEVQEEPHVDFLRVQAHLKNGGSVFITSRDSEKLTLPKQNRTHQNSKKSEWVMASYCSHV
jgi:hypothetical protein